MSKLFKLLLIVFFVSVHADAAKPPVFIAVDNGMSLSSSTPSVVAATVATDAAGNCRIDTDLQLPGQAGHCAADCVFLAPVVAISIRAIRQFPDGSILANGLGARVSLPRRPPIAV